MEPLARIPAVNLVPLWSSATGIGRLRPGSKGLNAVDFPEVFPEVSFALV